MDGYERRRPEATSLYQLVRDAVEITRCPTCAGRTRSLDVVTDPGDIARALGERGHARAPPRRPAPRQLELDLGAA